MTQRPPQLRLANDANGSATGQNDRLGPCKVVILAGGYGTRLAERTDEMPKPMVEIGGWPILWHILRTYSHYGFNEFLIAGGYKYEIIKRFFLEYHHRDDDVLIDFAADDVKRLARANRTETRAHDEPWRVGVIDTGNETMTGGRIRRLANHLTDGTFLLTYGDGLSDVDIGEVLRFHRCHGRLATLTAVRQRSQFGRPQLDGERVTTFAEKPHDSGEWINAGFLALEPQVLRYIHTDQSSFETDVLPMLAADDQLRAYRHEGFFQPMDTLRDVRHLNGMWNADRAPWKVWDEPRAAVVDQPSEGRRTVGMEW